MSGSTLTAVLPYSAVFGSPSGRADCACTHCECGCIECCGTVAPILACVEAFGITMITDRYVAITPDLLISGTDGHPGFDAYETTTATNEMHHLEPGTTSSGPVRLALLRANALHRLADAGEVTLRQLVETATGEPRPGFHAIYFTADGDEPQLVGLVAEKTSGDAVTWPAENL